MKAKYDAAEMELVLFAREDVITASGVIDEDDEPGMGILE